LKFRLRYLIPVGVGLLATAFLSAVYFGIVSWAESPQHAVELFWEQRWLVIPILVGFGVQAALYSILKFGLYLPVQSEGGNDFMVKTAAPGASVGAGGTTSTVAMVACCAHHVADVLPILGLTVAATFLAKYQTAFMAAGLTANMIGIAVILRILIRERRLAFAGHLLFQS
jgi:hypothetical protein